MNAFTLARDRDLNRSTGLARRILACYRQWAQEQHLLEGELLRIEVLQVLLEHTAHASASAEPLLGRTWLLLHIPRQSKIGITR